MDEVKDAAIKDQMKAIDAVLAEMLKEELERRKSRTAIGGVFSHSAAELSCDSSVSSGATT